MYLLIFRSSRKKWGCNCKSATHKSANRHILQQVRYSNKFCKSAKIADFQFAELSADHVHHGTSIKPNHDSTLNIIFLSLYSTLDAPVSPPPPQKSPRVGKEEVNSSVSIRKFICQNFRETEVKTPSSARNTRYRHIYIWAQST